MVSSCGVEIVRKGQIIPQVSIVSRIVTTDKMTEGGLAVSPRKVLAKDLGSFEQRNLLAERVVLGRDIHVLDVLVAGRLVHGHVEHAKVKLAQVEHIIVDVLGADQVLDQLIGNDPSERLLVFVSGALLPGGKVLGRKSGVVLAERFELRRGPAPVLEHLAGGLDKVADGVGAVEAGVCGL